MKKEVLGIIFGLISGLAVIYFCVPSIKSFVNGFLTDMTAAKQTLGYIADSVQMFV